MFHIGVFHELGRWSWEYDFWWNYGSKASLIFALFLFYISWERVTLRLHEAPRNANPDQHGGPSGRYTRPSLRIVPQGEAPANGILRRDRQTGQLRRAVRRKKVHLIFFLEERFLLFTEICSEVKWNNGPRGSDADRCKAEIILINFPLCNNF